MEILFAYLSISADVLILSFSITDSERERRQRHTPSTE